MAGCGRSKWLMAACGLVVLAVACVAKPQAAKDWGSDHVGKPLPEFASGDECLFCHRNDVGPSWADNRHSRTLRAVTGDEPALVALKQSPGLDKLAAEVTLLMGNAKRQRFLKPAAAYGQLELLNTSWSPPQADKAGQLLDTEKPDWNARHFGDNCAGCHATAVDSNKRSFASWSLDCFVCHGDVPAQHAKDTTQVFLAKKRKDSARVITSICAQCHLRGGKSKSSGLPYANNFVAGDNLFRDFQVDLSEKAIATLNPGDRHVFEIVRDVTVLGNEEITCLSCHQVHKQSAKIHHRVTEGAGCATCHLAGGSKKKRVPYEMRGATCGY